MHFDTAGRNRTRGITLVLALVCLLVAATIGATIVRTLVSEHRQVTRRQRQLQTLWVAESAIQRAAAQLAADPDYTGETWAIPAAAVGEPWAATAIIRVEPAGGQAQLRRVSVTARYPDDPLEGVILERELSIPHVAGGES
jgi:type II secretory pathway component PulK